MNNSTTTIEAIEAIEEIEEIEEVIKDFEYNTYELYDNTLTYDKGHHLLSKDLNKIKKLVHKIIKSKGVLFIINENANGEKTIDCKIPSFFKIMRECIETGIIFDIGLRFHVHCLNPYIELFIKNVKDENNLEGKIDQYLSCHKLFDDNMLVKFVDIFNALITNIRIEGKNPEFKTALNNYQNSFNENYKSLSDYINKLFVKYARLLVLRIDFHYRKDVDNPYLTEIERNEKYWQAKEDLEHLIRNMRSNKKLFKHMVGYAWKLEYAPRTGFHYHLFFFFNEKEVQGDIIKAKKIGDKAKKIGDYWQNNITKGRGRYFNCNAKKHEYKFLGVGKIHRNDVALRAGLIKAAEYVTKTDSYNARVVGLEENGRIFDRMRKI